MSQIGQQIEFPFSGREKEQEALERLLDKSLRGEGGLAFITGELGVGKSRLAQEILRIGKGKGFTCLTSKSPRGGSLLPYSVWVECLRQLTTEMSVQSFFDACGSFSRQVLKLLPELDAVWNRSGPRAKSTEPNQSAHELVGGSPVQIFDAVSQFFYRLSSRFPLLILLDDLQWCDKTSLDLLRYLAGSGLRTRRIVVLCVCRDTQLETENRSLSRFISDFLTAENVNENIHLERFDAVDTRIVIRNAVGLGRVTPAFCDLLYRKTGGNPFFMREILVLLAEKGSAAADSVMPWQFEGLHELEVPSTLQQVVKQRLAPLDEELVEVLRTAALIGEDFDLEILNEASNIKDEARLLELIQTATKAGIVHKKEVARRPSLYSFADEILIDVLIEDLSLEELQEYHLAIAQVMESTYAEKLNEHAAELALHFQRGADFQKCLEYSVKAGDFAASTNAHDEALRHYTVALESLQELNGEGATQSRGPIVERLGDELEMLGRSPASFRAWDEALKAYEVAGEGKKAAALHRKIGWRYTVAFISKGNEEKALEHFKAALDLMQGPEGPHLAYLYHHLAVWHWYYGGTQTAREYAEKSLQLARKYGLSEIEALCFQILGFTSPIEDLQTAMEQFKRSEHMRSEYIRSWIDLSTAFGRISWWLGLSYSFAKDDSLAALPYLLESIQTAKMVSSAPIVMLFRGSLALWGYFPLGRWSEARKEVAEALAWSHLESFPMLRGVVYAVLGNLCLREGDLGKAEEFLLKGYSAYQQLPGLAGLLFVSPCHASLARICMDRGDHSRAEKYLREGREALKRRGMIVDTAYEMPIILELLVEVCESREKRREALSYLEELRTLTKSTDQNWARAYHHQAAGFMASEMEEWEGALEEYEECTKYWKALARPYELAKTYQAMALMHQNMGKIETANQLFEGARDIFERLGAKLDVDRVLSGKNANEDASAFSIARLRGSAKVNSKSIFDYLEDAFIADYYSKKSAPEASGWRSFVDIARQTKIPQSAFYKREAKDSGGLGELQRMGLVEIRFYTGERGRGGKITRARIAYDKEEIRKHISRRIGKISHA